MPLNVEPGRIASELDRTAHGRAAGAHDWICMFSSTSRRWDATLGKLFVSPE